MIHLTLPQNRCRLIEHLANLVPCFTQRASDQHLAFIDLGLTNGQSCIARCAQTLQTPNVLYTSKNVSQTPPDVLQDVKPRKIRISQFPTTPTPNATELHPIGFRYLLDKMVSVSSSIKMEIKVTYKSSYQPKLYFFIHVKI